MEEHRPYLLLVEDDENLGFVIKDYLEMQGYDVDLQRDGLQGFSAFQQLGPQLDMCILDVMMPYKDGFTLAKDIRVLDEHVPIIFLTAKNMQEDKIKGLRLGADDYLTKPFSSEELGLRIEAVLKRSRNQVKGEEKKNLFELGLFTFDYLNQQLLLGDERRNLTRREADVLKMLCVYQNKVLRRDVALQQIWGENDYFMGRSMDVYITKLRKYLKDDERISITNIHGTGFKLEVLA